MYEYQIVAFHKGRETGDYMADTEMSSCDGSMVINHPQLSMARMLG